MNGDYLSNGNGVNKDGDNSSETSSSSVELASTPQTALQRDNVEDDLDAEMPSSPPTPPALSGSSASNANLLLPGANGSLNGKDDIFLNLQMWLLCPNAAITPVSTKKQNSLKPDFYAKL